jgi:hypothetical protein
MRTRTEKATAEIEKLCKRALSLLGKKPKTAAAWDVVFGKLQEAADKADHHRALLGNGLQEDEAAQRRTKKR